MNDVLKISVVIACLNAEKTIERTLRSIAEQQYRNLEVIVVDGLSTDGTVRYRPSIRLYGLANHLRKGSQCCRSH